MGEFRSYVLSESLTLTFDPVGFELVSLVDRAGLDRAQSEVLALIEEVVEEHICRVQ